ncbi:MAG: DUF3343 domain-containing protein [Lachnospiraceae bacterium]
MSMRKKQLRTVITFPSTVSAMAMEDFCKDQGLPGRLIPVPGQIRAGCGLAWMAPPDESKQLELAMAEAGIMWEQIGNYEL